MPFFRERKMTIKKKAAPVAKPVSKARPPKKLIPRTASAVVVVAESEPPVEAPVVVEIAATPPAEAGPVDDSTVKARPPRKPSREDETVARHQKVLAEALVMAQAINYDQPVIMRQAAAKAKKPAKPAKTKKIKLIRDSYAMPDVEYVRIAELKKRLAGVGVEVKKSELLRGGIAMLAALSDEALKTVMAGVERIKTGRPAK
jgi:hypothetical protein